MSLTWWLLQLVLIAVAGVLVTILLKLDMIQPFKTVIIVVAILGLVLWFIKVVMPRLGVA